MILNYRSGGRSHVMGWDHDDKAVLLCGYGEQEWNEYVPDCTPLSQMPANLCGTCRRIAFPERSPEEDGDE